jgi:hypothetical protein
MEQALLEAITSIDWALLFKLCIMAVIALYLKKYFDNVSSYMMFRSNKDLGKNVKVKVNGEEGFITHVSWKFIYVKFSGSENELIIPISKWTNQRWEVVKNGKNKEQKNG